MHLQALSLALTALFTSAALAQSSTGYFITIPTTGGSSPTAAPTATPSGLPGLVSELPDCAIPCFDEAAKTVKCATTDFKCLCQSSNLNSFAVNIGSCLTGGLGSKGGPSSTDSACEISNLSSLATKICASVNNGQADQAQLSSASAIASEKLSSASKTASANSPSSSSGGQNHGGARPEGAAMGMLAVVAAYAVLAL